VSTGHPGDERADSLLHDGVLMAGIRQLRILRAALTGNRREAS
jgi:hypothetical protein